jgi:hypothetical protein
VGGSESGRAAGPGDRGSGTRRARSGPAGRSLPDRACGRQVGETFGTVWLTELLGNRLVRFDPDAERFTACPLPASYGPAAPGRGRARHRVASRVRQQPPGTVRPRHRPFYRVRAADPRRASLRGPGGPCPAARVDRYGRRRRAGALRAGRRAVHGVPAPHARGDSPASRDRSARRGPVGAVRRLARPAAGDRAAAAAVRRAP